MEHLALEVFNLGDSTGSQYAVLPENTTITITDTSEIFADGDVWSFPFTLNVMANNHLFGTAGETHGSRLHEQINKRKARLWVEGMPLYLGYLRLSNEAEIDSEGNVDVTFESGQKSFKDMTEGAKANQVPMMDDVLIGMALWRKRWTSVEVKLRAYLTLTNEGVPITLEHDFTLNGTDIIEIECDGEIDGNAVQQYPRMVFPRGKFRNRDGGNDWDENCLNTDYPYDDAHPFCNIALCYQKYDYLKMDENGAVMPDYSAEPEAQRDYEYMPADRVNSAPNFYVIYWLRCLMKHLGIDIEENQMMDVEDLRRLFFVNTNCAYKEPGKLRTAETGSDDLRFGRYEYVAERAGDHSFDHIIPEYFESMKQEIIDNSKLTAENLKVTVKKTSDNITIRSIGLKVREVISRTHHKYPYKYREKNNFFHQAYATSDCFPNVDISEVISAIESGFGIRFLFSSDYKRVRIVLLRNIFRGSDIQNINCEIIGDGEKVENNIRGFRMTYGDSDDTHFYYKGFADLLPHIKTLWPDTSDTHDYSKWKLNAVYGDIIKRISAFDKTCYVTPNTGNAYGIKIDKNAKRYNELRPSLFGFADFMDAEDGDCTGEAETIKTINAGFTPAIMNDLNMEQERAGDPTQRFALFVNEAMRVRRLDFGDLPNQAQPGVKSYNDPTAFYDVNRLYENDSPASQMKSGGIVKPGEFAITSDMYASLRNVSIATGDRSLYGGGGGEGGWWTFNANATFDAEGAINEGYRLYLQDNYEPNEDGISPIEKHDWGLMLGIMRGSGDDAYVNYTYDPDDGEGNDTWDIIPGSSATAHPDTCDSYGNEWDYVGTRRAGRENAAEIFAEQFPDSNASFQTITNNGVDLFTVTDDSGNQYKALFMTPFPPNNSWHRGRFLKYMEYLSGHSLAEIRNLDAAGYMDYKNTLVETRSSQERCDTLRQLSLLALGYDSDIIIDHGVGSRFGRFSLKLRAEKPNPYFDPKQPESDNNQRYLQISNPNLRGRGLSDQLYKEYSYWIRNARIKKFPVRMELAQLRVLDKTKRVQIGDIMGFIRKMQFTVSNDTGLGIVTLEIMYI